MRKGKKESFSKRLAALALAVMLCAAGIGAMGCNIGSTGRASGTQDTQNGNNEKEDNKSGGFWNLLKRITNGGKGESDKSDTTISDEDFLAKANYLKILIDMYFWKDVDDEDLYEGMYRGLLDALDDPYSCYYTKEEYAELMESVEGVYCGIGALVNQSASTKVITIVRPFVNGPAYNAGVLPGDILTRIDGEDVSDWDLNLAVKRMKGGQGTTVDVQVWRSAENEYVDLTIIRDLIEVETVTYEMLEDSIGYIYIMEFDEVTADQFETALNALKKQGMKGLVIDIRDNPGGLLTTVCDMLDMFIEEGLIVYTLDKYEYKEEIKATPGSIGELPMAVLVNGNSASASEIFSGALQDYGLATIVGTQSFGKGIVQSILPLADGSAVKMTVSTYYTPAGRSIHGLGITPDVKVELDEELKQLVVIPLSADNQLQAAIGEVKKKIK
ncbi:MAG: S41 family peptidase [Lachnospiraceae bacterium]|nr:S41 family peptidase [Lachnospiraceae bacterium]